MSSTPVCDLHSPSDRTDDATVRVTPPILKRSWQEMKHRLNVLRVTNGAHIVMMINNTVVHVLN
jgi:hypothetical protein